MIHVTRVRRFKVFQHSFVRHCHPILPQT